MMIEPEPAISTTDAPTEAVVRPLLTVKESALAAGVHANTIRRRRADGDFPNAVKRESDGAWLLPIEDLLGAGFQLHRSTPPDDADAESPSPADLDRVAELERDLVAARARAERAEAVLIERERTLHEAQQRADLAEHALRMLMTAKRAGQ